MPSKSRSPLARIVVVFASVVMSFLAATAYAQHVQGRIDRAALEIAQNEAPSIEHLLKARAELRHIQILLHQHLSDGAGREPLDDVAEAQGLFRREIEAYRALPAFTGESELRPAFDLEMRRVEASVAEAADRIRRRDLQGASAVTREEVADEADRAGELIAEMVEVNAEQARDLARSIEHVRAHAALVEGGLDGASVLLTAALAFLLVGATRRHERLLEEHGRLQEARASELEQFAGRVAHDILSPLSAVGMALALVGRDVPAEGRARAAIVRGQSSLERVRRIVDSLLDFARAGGQPARGARAEVEVVLGDVLSELGPAAAEQAIALDVAPFAPCAVACSPGILTSLLTNLLRNAVKYMGDRAERRVEVRVHERGAGVRVEIADTGPGVPPDLQRQIFEPYVRGPDSGQPGIGLGLATVKRIAENHGGRAGVISAVGEGSVFWFELPSVADPPAAGGPPTAPGKA